MSKRHSLLAALALAGAAAAAPVEAHGQASPPPSGQARSARREIDTTFWFSKIGTIVVGNGSATVIVTGWDQTSIRIKAKTEEGSLRFEAASSRVLVETGGPRDEAIIQVTVPRGVRVVARTNTGNITVKDTWGDVDAETSSGNVIVAGARDVEATNLSGDLEVKQASGAVTLASNNGDCTVTDSKGSVEASSVSGDVVVRKSWSKIVRLETTNGTIQFESEIMPEGRYEFVTHDGAILLALPKLASAQIGITTWSGKVESEFPITLRPGFSADSVGTKRYTFTLGQGSARITAETFSGEVNITSSGGK
jgi:DUF4097 and DUF4098 domain-containing protein YvlB